MRAKISRWVSFQRDQIGRQPVSPDAPQRLTADVIHPFDARQIPLRDLVGAEQFTQAGQRAALRAVACEGERGSTVRQPDDLALSACRDFEAGGVS